MPRATANRDTERKDLKSCEGAFVVLRRMNYGERLKMMDLATKYSIQEDQDSAEGAKMEMMTQAQAVQCFEFKTCIVDHNLEDEAGRTLDFRSVIDVKSLDTLIAGEVAQWIDVYNKPPDISAEQKGKKDVPLVSASGTDSTEEK